MTPSGSQSARGKRWQSDTDSINQCPEVEANSIDDGKNASYTLRNFEKRMVNELWCDVTLFQENTEV